MSRTRALLLLALPILLALVSPVATGAALHAQAAASAVAEPTLDQVRELTTRYQDVKVALADGYIADPSGMCVSAAMEGRPAEEGAMGVHYLRPDLLGITGPPNPRVNGTSTHTDFRQPAILIYEPQADGSSKLVAVENLVFIKSWEAAGHTAPPTFQGHAFNKMQDDPATELDEAHGFEPHYDLHVWLYRENPKGMFAQFNSKVKCE
jgi:hypothetical protein